MQIGSDILKDLKLSSFVSVDIETTGLDYQSEDIIEFGAVKYVEGQKSETVNFLVKPSKAIPTHITRITGISDEMVKNSPTFNDVSGEILNFIGDMPIVAHNVSFDLPFLEYHFRRVEGSGGSGEKIRDYVYLPNDKMDTLLLAKMYLPFLSGFSLKQLADYYQISTDTFHRALPDAEVAGELFLNLIKLTLQTEFRDVKKILEILEPTDEPLKTFFFNLYQLLSSGKYHFPKEIVKEEFEFSANYYNIIGEDEAPNSGKLEIQPIDADEIGHFFDQGGILEQNFGVFEYRSSQLQMAKEVAQSFNNAEFTVVEAGTGTGKSLAYLLPAIKWSIKNYGPFGRVVISTNTKNLQEQLFFKDLPILHSVLKDRFKAVLLKGKANYLCLDKWYTVLNDLKYRVSTTERSKILPLYMWVKNTETGDISENNGFSADRNMSLWSKFIAENNYCPGKSCKYYNDCFLWRARNNAKNAHLVLVNHSLLFSDLAADQAVLSEYANVILDEAHNIEKVATDYLGTEITLWSFRDSFQKLHRKERIETGILIQFKKRLQFSDLEDSKKNLLNGHLEKLIPLVDANWQICQGFFKELTSQLNRMIPEQYQNEYNSRFRYQREDMLMDKMGDYHGEFVDNLNKLIAGINDLLDLFKELKDNSIKYQKQIYQELLAQFTQLDELKNNLQFLLAAEWDTYVYWFEISSRRNTDDSRLYAAPLNISEILYHKLYKNLNTAIFTSATLTVGQQFEYFLGRVGLNRIEEDRLKTLLLESPFNYDEQVLLAIPSYIPDPRSADYREHVRRFLEQLMIEQRRGTLVLFTSYALLNSMFDSLRTNYQSEKIPLLVQGVNGSRHTIITQFKEIPHSVLYGTDSFWEGVDVPGKSLEILLITKLPFDVPSEPVIQAKAELIKKQGGNPFMEYTIPEAVIKFRQGFGRLIRNKTDYGAVIILDNRVVKKMYGRLFLQSLPVQSKIFNSEEELWESLLGWFQNV